MQGVVGAQPTGQSPGREQVTAGEIDQCDGFQHNSDRREVDLIRVPVGRTVQLGVQQP